MPETGSLQEAIQEEYDASSVAVLYVTPGRILEVLLQADSFADAQQDELMRTTREIAHFVADRMSDEVDIETIAIELETQRTDIGPFFKRTAIRGEFPLSEL